MSVTLLKFDDTTGDIAPVTVTDTLEVGQIVLDGVGGIGLNAGGFVLSNLSDPMAQFDAATKGYVDSIVQSYAQNGSTAQSSDGTTSTGATGRDGKSILAGGPSPDNALGNIGDLYIQLSNGPYLWGPKATNGWPTQTVLLRGGQGDRGLAGIPGYSVRPSSINPPASTLGNNGDYAITTNGVLYGPKANGAYPQPGLNLASQVPGPPGAGIRTTQADPPPQALGSDGDYAISASAILYGPKNNGVWPSDGKNLVGPQGVGAQGEMGLSGPRGASVLFSNANPPPASLGSNQDFAITFDGQLYGPKTSGAWGNAQLSLIGSSGRDGAQGQIGPRGNALLQAQADPPDNGLGLPGDFALSPSSIIYGPKPQSNVWPSSGVSIVGPRGPASLEPGPMGYSILTGNGAPSTQGNIGDVYVDLQNGNLYAAKTSSGWSSTYTSLVGPRGAVGVQGLRGAQITKLVGYSSQDYLPTGGFLNNDFVITSDLFIFGPFSQSNGWPQIGFSITGPRGQAGLAGATIRISASTPDPNLGNVGDFVFEQDNYQFIGPKTSNGWPTSGTSLRGATGQSVTGPRGASVLQADANPPSTGFGSLGDYALTSSGYLFGPKTSSGWSNSPLYLVGASGAKGADSQVPGPMGYSIDSGSGPPTASIGRDGDAAYIDILNGNLYGARASGAWPSSFTSLVGPKGATVRGSQIYNGTGAPSSDLTTYSPNGPAQPGDLYFRTDTQAIYVLGN